MHCVPGVDNDTRCPPEDVNELLALGPISSSNDDLSGQAVVSGIVRLAGGDGTCMVLQVGGAPFARHYDVGGHAAQLARHLLLQRWLAYLDGERMMRLFSGDDTQRMI